MDFCPYALNEISVLTESTLGHLCYCLTDVPPQPNSPPVTVTGESRTFKNKNASSSKQLIPKDEQPLLTD